MADAKDFLFEIGTEEMPSAPLNNAVKQLGTMIAKGLDEAGLAHGEVRVISSPRRLAALVADVATATDEVHEVKRGPAANIAFDADGNATKAAQGFARKCGVSAEDLVRREDTDGREYVFAEKNIPSAPATPILTALCEKTIAGLQWPNYRSQRWGHEHATFVRPVRWISCLLGEDVVPVSFADVTSGNTTRGHRVLGPGDHVVASPAVYEQVLEDAGVPSVVVRPSSPVSPRSRLPVPAAMSIRPRRSLKRSSTFASGRRCSSVPSTRSSSRSRTRSSASPCSPISATSRSMTARAS